MRWLFLILAALAAAGCSQMKDPNDPKQIGAMDPDVLLRQLKWASDAANARVAKGEITEQQAKELVSKEADRLLSEIKIDSIDRSLAWKYGEIFRTSKRWELAEKVFAQAVEDAENWDRRVNDTVRLAHVKANLGKVDEAIQVARKVYNAPAKETAPILPAVLLEIVPVAEGKGHDADLAKLLEDAIYLHDKTLVNEETQAGKDFLLAKPHHLRNAWLKVQQLYVAAGEVEKANAAAGKAKAMMSGKIRV